ncbi:hemolysin family protein [Halocatena halophila]|uniref:hemolysin family protein n=1 Tax=Halocatena halophila TaxID=2814576 RepID=UPI002ED66375
MGLSAAYTLVSVTTDATIVSQLALGDGIAIGTDLIAALGAASLILLIGLSAFFSSSEIAMFSIASHRVEALAQERTAGKTLKALKDDPHRLLVTILVGNNLANIAMSSIATGVLAMYTDQGTAVAVATFGITGLVLLFGESWPKSYAIENSESWSLRVSRPLKVAEYLLMPLVVLFDFLTRQINRITGGQTAIESSYVTRQEIVDIIETGEREGVLDAEERDILQRTLRFNDTIAKEVMTPRLDITALESSASIDEGIERCIQSGHARLPVYDGSLDNIVGVVHVRDLVRDRTYGEGTDVDLEDLTQPVLHVPESKNVDELLREMRENRMHMVVVIDEFGTTEGLITMEDAVEEIVGEILEGGEDEPVEFVDEETAIVRGEVNIEIVNDALDIELPEGEEFETIAGFVFNRVGRLVEPGEAVEYEDVTITIEQVDNTRIMKARIVKTSTDPVVEADSPETIES